MNSFNLLREKRKMTEEKCGWLYFPGYFSEEEFPFKKLYEELEPKVGSYGGKLRNGGIYVAKRKSCLFSKTRRDEYSSIPSYDWSESKEIEKIKNTVEEVTEEKFDYCLAHIYKDGCDNIAYHRDSEAMRTCIVSISFGATRKFRFRKIGETKGFHTELSLGSGDMVYMLPGCQRRFLHSVPVEKKVKEPRINLTFRKYE